LDQSDHRVSKEDRVLQGRLVHQVQQDLLALLVYQDQLDRLDQQGTVDHLDLILDLQANQDLLGTRVNKVNQDQWDQLDLMDNQDNSVQWVHQAPRASVEHQE